MEEVQQKFPNKDGISLESLLTPYLMPITSYFFAPSYRRYFKENPIQKNPNSQQIPKMYWGGHPRSAMTFGFGVLYGAIIISDQITKGLEEAVARNDYNRLIALSSTVVITNLASWTYEGIRKIMSRRDASKMAKSTREDAL